MERLLLLDGNGLIYRGYFALIDQWIKALASAR